jgi:hypothetical protein
MMGIWELKWFVLASQWRAISSDILRGPARNILKLNGSPLLKRPFKK